MDRKLVALVLAAGKGTRMRSEKPKVLHELAGEPLLGHVLHAMAGLALEQTLVVVGHGAHMVEAMLPVGVRAVRQTEQLGTGHAVDQASPLLAQYEGDILILSGDVPLLSPRTIHAMLQKHQEEGAALTMLSTMLPDPTGYGRVLRDAAGLVRGIVEHKDATPEQREIREINAGTYLASWPMLRQCLRRVTPNNAQGEYYLTDAVALLVAEGHAVAAHVTPDPVETQGVNSRRDLIKLQAEYQQRSAEHWLDAGVTVLDPATTILGPYVELGEDTVVEPGAILLGHCQVGRGCKVGAYSQLRNSRLGDHVEVLCSYLTDATVGNGTHIGPYAHLRGGASTGENVRIGNFVELKNTQMGDGSKAAHLSYLGDATLGKNVNIGCGTITCNYDGAKKHPTLIQDGAFIGSNATLVAPLIVAAGAYVAAGSTITENVPAQALALGRARQVIKEDWVPRFRRSVAPR